MNTAYRALLRLYPKSFRAEYGEEMSAVFARELRSASGGGAVVFMVRTFFDTLVNAAAVHGDMTKQDVKYALRSLGRTLAEADIEADQNPIVISDRLWRTRFAGDLNVIGRTMALDDATSMIVGVMPRDFIFPDRDTDYWRPFRFVADNGDGDRSNHYLAVIARLKPTVTFEQARSEMRIIAAQLEQQFPKELADTGASAFRWRDEVRAQSRTLLWALVGASLCVLLIACTNLANLLMSRALARRTEFAVRAAVGASVDRLVRQMLTDSLVLAVAGGVLGVLLAAVAAPLVARMVPSTLPIAEVPPVDLRMLFGAGLLTLASGRRRPGGPHRVRSGRGAVAAHDDRGDLMPAWRAVRVDPLTATRAD